MVLFALSCGLFLFNQCLYLSELQRHWHEVSVWKNLGGVDSIEHHPNPHTIVEVFNKLWRNEPNEGGKEGDGSTKDERKSWHKSWHNNGGSLRQRRGWGSGRGQNGLMSATPAGQGTYDEGSEKEAAPWRDGFIDELKHTSDQEDRKHPTMVQHMRQRSSGGLLRRGENVIRGACKLQRNSGRVSKRRHSEIGSHHLGFDVPNLAAASPSAAAMGNTSAPPQSAPTSVPMAPGPGTTEAKFFLFPRSPARPTTIKPSTTKGGILPILSENEHSISQAPKSPRLGSIKMIPGSSSPDGPGLGRLGDSSDSLLDLPTS